MKWKVTKKLFCYLMVAFSAWGCGTRVSTEKPKPPPLFSPEAGICPGALPGANIQVSSALGESNAPVIAWTGNEFAIAWWDLRGSYPEVRSVQLDRSGKVSSPEKRLLYDGSARDPSFTFDGEELHLVFVDGERVLSHRVGKDQKPRSLDDRGKMPAAGAFGAAVWVAEGNLWFVSDAMMSPPESGRRKQLPGKTVIATGGIETPEMVFNGRFYGVVWSASVPGGREIRFQRVSPKGQLLGETVRVSREAGTSRNPTIAVSMGDFAVAWTHAATTEDNPGDRFRIYFAVIPEVGDKPIMTRQLQFRGSADQVALAATGKEFGLSWVGSREPMGSAVYFGRMGLDGEPLEEIIEVTDGVPLTCGRPDLVWDGEGYGVVWHDDRARTGSEVFFAYIECGQETTALDFTNLGEDGVSATDSPDAGSSPGPVTLPPPTDKKPDGSRKDSLPELKEVFDESN